MVPPIGGNRHSTHTLTRIRKVAGIQASRRIVVMTKLDGGVTEAQIGWCNGLLPALQRWHRMVPELIGESADRVGSIFESYRKVVVIVV